MYVISISIGYPNGYNTFVKQFLIDDSSCELLGLDHVVEEWTDELQNIIVNHIMEVK